MRKVFPIVFIVVGILMFGLGIGFAIGGFSSSVQSITSTTMLSDSWTSPGSTSTRLEPGTYTVYEDVGPGGEVTVDPDSIVVGGPGGTQVTTTCLSCGGSTSTLTLGTATYVGVVSFQAAQAGEYTVASQDDSGASLVVGPSLGDFVGDVFDSIGGALGWTALAVVGGILVVAGVIWLIVAAVTGRPKPAPVAGIPYYGAAGGPAQMPSNGGVEMPTGGPTPAGSWYPDPGDPTQLRWWDGRQWTDHRRPR